MLLVLKKGEYILSPARVGS